MRFVMIIGLPLMLLICIPLGCIEWVVRKCGGSMWTPDNDDMNLMQLFGGLLTLFGGFFALCWAIAQ